VFSQWNNSEQQVNIDGEYKVLEQREGVRCKYNVLANQLGQEENAIATHPLGGIPNVDKPESSK